MGRLARNRPPIFGDSSERATAEAVLALLPAVATGDNEARAARDKGVQWLTDTKTDDDPQSIALRLVLWQRLGRPADQLEPLAARIQARKTPMAVGARSPKCPATPGRLARRSTRSPTLG